MNPGTFSGHYIDELVHHALFGTYNLNQQTAVTGSLVASIANGQTLTAQQQAMLNWVSQPILAMMIKVQRDPITVANIARTLEPWLVEAMATRLADTVLSVVNNAYSADADAPPMPDVVKEGVKQLADDLNAITTKQKDYTEQFNELATMVNFVVRSFPKTQDPLDRR
jgi:hypothetical protein